MASLERFSPVARAWFEVPTGSGWTLDKVVTQPGTPLPSPLGHPGGWRSRGAVGGATSWPVPAAPSLSWRQRSLRVAGAYVVLVDDEPCLYVEKGAEGG